MFYFFDGLALWCLGDPEFFELEAQHIKHSTVSIGPIWFKSYHKEPSEVFGFKFIEEWV